MDMSKSNDLVKIEGQSDSRQREPELKVYQKPELKCFGEVKDITLGGSPGFSDSGNPGMEHPF
ncbi:MAG: hypothetical protein ACI8P9_001104 [Parasphingorhabdus sp.]|jgi:hypothetical protein